MSLIIEFELSTPILRQTSRANAEIDLHVETISRSSEDEFKLIFWAHGSPFSNFDSALEADTTVKDMTLLEEADDHRLYRITLSDTGRQSLTYPDAAHHDITFLEILAGEKTQIRARVPHRDALFAYRDACREKEISFRIKRIYQEDASYDGQYGLTAGQTEALLVALREGYFEVPRESELREIAADLDVSTQALSTRLRRGQRNLLQSTLGSDPDLNR